MKKGPRISKYSKSKDRIAVFIDAANFEISLKLANLKVDYHKLLTSLRKEGKLVILRYYSPTFQTKAQGRFFTFIKNTGKELRKQADQFTDLRKCPFVKKKLPFGSAHDNLSTATEVYNKK